MRILMAEDDEMCRHVMAMFLETLGYYPSIVENGKECLEEATRGEFDLILTDLEMPEMSGLECARALRLRGKEALIVAVSGSGAPRVSELCVEAGMNGFLAKPFDGPALKTVLRDASASVKKRQALVA